MILADFSDLQQARNQTQKTKPNKTEHLKQSKTTTQVNKQKNVHSYLDELGIGNLAEFYESQVGQKRQEELAKQKKAKQKLFQQSIQRLYTTGLAKTSHKDQSPVAQNNPNRRKQGTQDMRSSQHSHNSDDQNNQDDMNGAHQLEASKHYYNEIYSEQEGFDHKARVKMLQNECHKIRDKLFGRFTSKYLIWVAENESDQAIKSSLQNTFKPSNPHAKSQIILRPAVIEYFLKSLLPFILNVENSKVDTHQRFFAFYSDYINKFKLSKWQAPIQNMDFEQKTYNKLKFLAYMLPFVYFLLDFTLLQRIQEVQFNNTADVFKWIHTKYAQARTWDMIYSVFEAKLNPKFTVPFQTKLYEVKKPIQTKSNRSQSEQKRSPVKANPIPASTYNKPKKRTQSQKKQPTQPEPFNFTQTHSNIPKLTVDQLYSWNRNFKAKPVPKTNYQPQLTFNNPKQTQWDKKAHTNKLNQEASFPQTMAYLQNYDEFQENRRKQLEEKYTKKKNLQMMKSKPIPDFQKIHKNQQQILEKKKQMNRTNTQPKPFNFTQTKKSDLKAQLKSTFMIDQQLQHQQQKKKKRITQDTNMPEARSTAKFNAYITMRKQEKQEKRAQVKQRQQMKKRKEEDMKAYKEILKQRMQNELLSQPRAIQYNNNQGNNQNIVKVDLENIYLQRPLLMSGTQGHRKKKPQDDQKTCYTDAFEPII